MTGDYLMGQMYVSPDLAAAAETDPIISGMRETHDYLRNGHEAIKTALRTQDPTQTSEAHFMEVRRKAERWLNDGARKAEASRMAAERALGEIDREITSKLGISDGKYATEVRSHFAQMDKNDRISAVQSAIGEFDKETMGALLSAPAYLSGLSNDEQAMFRRLYSERHAAAPIARKTVIEKSLHVNGRTFDEALMASLELFPRDKVADISNRIEKAQAARSAILPG